MLVCHPRVFFGSEFCCMFNGCGWKPLTAYYFMCQGGALHVCYCHSSLILLEVCLIPAIFVFTLLLMTNTLICRYIATIDGVVNKRHLIAISEGTVIEGVHCTPDSVELLPPQPNISKPRLRVVVLFLSVQDL